MRTEGLDVWKEIYGYEWVGEVQLLEGAWKGGSILETSLFGLITVRAYKRRHAKGQASHNSWNILLFCAMVFPLAISTKT